MQVVALLCADDCCVLKSIKSEVAAVVSKAFSINFLATGFDIEIHFFDGRLLLALFLLHEYSGIFSGEQEANVTQNSEFSFLSHHHYLSK